MNVLFEWDEGNTKHVLLDHPERGNTIEEVEAILQDENRITKFDRLDPMTNEPRYFTLGVGTEGIVKYVAFVLRNGKIRPITCYKASKKQRAYYERAHTTSSEESEKGSGGD